MASKQQFNVYLTPETVRQMKHRAIDCQQSLSDLVERVLVAYLAQDKAAKQGETMTNTEQQATGLVLQPMVHVTDLRAAITFYEQLGATVQHGSRDGDWALLQIGGSELGLLAHPANPEQHESRVELNFDYQGDLVALEARLRAAGVTIVRPVGDEGFGYQLQIADSDGELVKINQLDPTLIQ